MGEEVEEKETEGTRATGQGPYRRASPPIFFSPTWTRRRSRRSGTYTLRPYCSCGTGVGRVGLVGLTRGIAWTASSRRGEGGEEGGWAWGTVKGIQRPCQHLPGPHPVAWTGSLTMRTEGAGGDGAMTVEKAVRAAWIV